MQIKNSYSIFKITFVNSLLLFFFLLASHKSYAVCSYIAGQGSNCPVNTNYSNTYLGHCFQFNYYDSGNYFYTRYECDSNITGAFPNQSCGKQTHSSGQVRRTQALSGAIGCWAAQCGPLLCNDAGPSPTSGGTPALPGGNCSDRSIKTAPCPVQSRDRKCSRVPCASRSLCGCGNCLCGGGPPGTPTPTPTPYCTLSCPGGRDASGIGSINQGSHGGKIGINDGEDSQSQITPVQPPVVTGAITYQGFNNFVCGTFKDGLGYNAACPAHPGNSFLYPVRYHMLCGGQSFDYTAEVEDGGMYSIGGGFNPTAGPSLTPAPYPPGCVFGSPAPTNPFPTSSGGGIWSGGGNGSNSCTCEVSLGCQTQLYPIQSNGCVANVCDMTIVPDNPANNEDVTFNLSGSNFNSLNFDDGTALVSNPSSPTIHTFLNAGVYDVKLTCNGGAQTCTKTMNAYCYTIPKLWYKLKDASFNKYEGLNDPIPDPVIAYDSDDTATRYLIGGDGGVTSAQFGINVGTASASLRDWQREQYTVTTRVTPQSFLDYIKSRKQYVTVSASGTITGNDLTKGKINVATGNFTLDSASIQSASPFVLVVNGDVTITGNINPPAKSLAIIATGKVNITAAVTEVNGILMGNTVDFASDVGVGNTTPNTLKVSGNIATVTASDMTKRQGSDIKKPSIFIYFKPEMYIDLLPMISVRNYQWLQLTP